ncbi:hypothetical protein T08_16656, partial [Trichinella sp. T8]
LRVSNTCSSDVYFSREQIVDQLPSSSSWHVTLPRIKLLRFHILISNILPAPMDEVHHYTLAGSIKCSFDIGRLT